MLPISMLSMNCRFSRAARRGLDHLQAGLRGECHPLRVDRHDAWRALHVDDRAWRGRAWRQRVEAAHRAHRDRDSLIAAASEWSGVPRRSRDGRAAEVC